MPQRMTKRDLELDVESLGPCKIHTPLDKGDGRTSFVNDSERILINLYADDAIERCRSEILPPSFEVAGPRQKIYFDPTKTKAAIVTCGGLCPGINSVIRAVVLELYYNYGVSNLLGIKYGLQGFIPRYGHPVIELDSEMVTFVHGRGGSLLGMSRGPQDVGEVVDAMERLNISVLFTIGGDGTLKATQKIKEEVTRRGLKTATVAIPKTIDNDINWVSKTFGFDSAVEAAAQVILSAHNEAISAPNGVGLVKVMGRQAGFVAANTTLALADVNFCLIPEVPFDLEGPKGLLNRLVERIKGRGHAVIIVAEGAGQHFFAGQAQERDASGNVKLKNIGLYLKERITEHFQTEGIELNLKYIDPSYTIRSVPANPIDRIFCGFLGQHAAHAAMAGKTGLMVSHWNNAFIHAPLSLATARRKYVDPKGSLWRSVREVTGQGSLVND